MRVKGGDSEKNGARIARAGHLDKLAGRGRGLYFEHIYLVFRPIRGLTEPWDAVVKGQPRLTAIISRVRRLLPSLSCNCAHMLALLRSARALGELPALLRCVTTQADALIVAAAVGHRPPPPGPARAADPLPSMLGFHALLPETAQTLARLSPPPAVPVGWPSPFSAEVTLPDFGATIAEIGGQFLIRCIPSLKLPVLTLNLSSPLQIQRRGGTRCCVPPSAPSSPA